jgi:hypothetical protein
VSMKAFSRALAAEPDARDRRVCPASYAGNEGRRRGESCAKLDGVSIELSAVLGVVFGGLAAACAFFISYHEYKNNWNFRGNAAAMALRSALVAFVFFLVAAVALGFAFRLAA